MNERQAPLLEFFAFCRTHSTCRWKRMARSVRRRLAQVLFDLPFCALPRPIIPPTPSSIFPFGWEECRMPVSTTHRRLE